MWSTPSSIARRRTARAAAGSRGGPKTPGPASCIAPKPMRLIGLSPRNEVVVMTFTLRYSRAPDKRGIDPGTRTTTHAPRPARRVPAPPSRAHEPGEPRAAGQRPPAHARPAPRGGRAAGRGRAVLVHVARAGPGHHAVGERPRRARARARPPP